MTDTTKYPGFRRLQDSLLDQNTLFGTASSAREERDVRLARAGLAISVILLAVAGLTEVFLIVSLLYDFIR